MTKTILSGFFSCVDLFDFFLLMQTVLVTLKDDASKLYSYSQLFYYIGKVYAFKIPIGILNLH